MVFEEDPQVQDGYFPGASNLEESSSDGEPSSSHDTSIPAFTQRSMSPREASRWSSIFDSSVSPQGATFTLPQRSIFTSGLPTSSISVNTAQASMSSPAPVSTLHPLSSLSGPNSGSARRASRESPRSVAQRRTRSTRVQKHTDDPSTSTDDGNLSRRPASRPTSQAVSNLFAATDFSGSRTTSFNQFSSGYVRCKYYLSCCWCELKFRSTLGFEYGATKSFVHARPTRWKAFGYHSTLFRNCLCIAQTSSRPSTIFLFSSDRTMV